MIAATARSARLSLILLFTLGGAAVRAAQHWIVAKTPHFEMYSDDSVEQSRLILSSLEEFRANFLKLLPLKAGSEPRTTIVVFDSESDFRPYKPLYQGKPRDLAGYFQPRRDEVEIAITTDYPNPEADPREVIYHEYVHLLLEARKAHYPLWLNEGLAEVFSTFKVADGKVIYGTPKSGHVAYLQQRSLWPLPRLFAVTAGSPDYNEDARIGTFYAESWALTHYLIFGADKANSVKVGRFVQLLSAGYDVAASYHDAFGQDFGTLESALRRYLSGGGYYKTGSPTLAQNIPVVFRPATDLERDTALLNLRWRVHEDGDAGAAAFALLKRDPNQARPHELLAAIAASAGDMDSAREHWQKAAELKSDNPWVYLQLLDEAVKPYESATMLDVRLPAETTAPWRAWAARAWELSPDNPEVIQDALMVEALAEKIDLRVANRGQAAVLKLPDAARGLLALAIIHWRVDQAKSARNLLNLAEAEPRAEVVTRATIDALRYRLPEETGPATPAGIVGPAGAPRVAPLQSVNQGEAAKYLDRVLAEKGTLAPWVKLDRFVASIPAPAEAAAPEHAEELRQKAKAGDADAMYDLAVAYACGLGVEFSPAVARDWLQQAIDHGHGISNPDLIPSQTDPMIVAKFLRAQRSPTAGEELPPLDADLGTQIAAAATTSDYHAPVVAYRPALLQFPADPSARGVKGKSEATVRLMIRADGLPDRIQASAFTDPAAATAAENFVRGWRFIPTIRDHKPAVTFVELPIAFESGRSPPR